MEFYIETSELQRIVRSLDVVSKRNTNDFTGRILIEADSDKNIVSFISNNGSEAVTIESSKVKVKTSGELSIVYGKIVRFVSSFSPLENGIGLKEFCFKLSDNHLIISVKNSHENGKVSKGRLKLETFDTHTIQKPNPFKKTNFILNSIIVKTAITKVIYAIDQNETKQFIQGMCIRFDKDNIYFAGTNGRMLSEYVVKNTGDLTEGSFILKYGFIMGIKRIVNEDVQLFFEITKNRVTIKFNEVCYSGDIVVGHEYPEYYPALNDFSDTIIMDKSVLMGHLYPFMDVLDGDDYNRLTFSIKNNKVIIYNDVASFEYDEPVDYKGELSVDINGQFFIQTVEAIQDDTIKICFSNSEGSLIFDSSNFEDQKALITHIRRR